MSFRNNNEAVIQQTQKPEVLKSGKVKALVVVLCALSFIAGWFSSRSHYNNECLKAGGQINHTHSIAVCQL